MRQVAAELAVESVAALAALELAMVSVEIRLAWVEEVTEVEPRDAAAAARVGAALSRVVGAAEALSAAAARVARVLAAAAEMAAAAGAKD